MTTRRATPRSPSLFASSSRRREVTRHERQHARRDHRREAGRERDREARAHHSIPASSSSIFCSVSSSSPDASVGRRFVVAAATPAPDTEREDKRAHEHAHDWQPPGEKVKALVRRLGHDRLPVVRDERRLDPLRRPARRDLLGDERLDLLRGLRVRLVERRVACRAHDLPLEERERRAGMRARCGRPGERERRCDDGKQPDHETSSKAARNRAAKSPPLIGPARWATIFPLESTTYVSGTCEIP